MGDLSKPLALFAAFALLATGLVACGDDSGSDSTRAASPNSAQAPASTGQNGQDESPATAADGGTGSEEPGSGKAGEADAKAFVPRPHDDSGGGASQFRVEGGDNSVQEFGEEAKGPAFEEAATVVHEFLDARAQGAWAAACERLASDVVESFKRLAAQGQGAEAAACAEILQRLTNPDAKPALIEEARRADVGSLRIEGNRAFVIYRSSGDVIMAMPMTKEDGSWKVATLAGTPLN